MIYPYPHLNCYKLCAMEIRGKSKTVCMEGVFVILMDVFITLAYSGPAEIRSSFLGVRYDFFLGVRCALPCLLILLKVTQLMSLVGSA